MIKGIWERTVKAAVEAVFPSNIYCIRCGSLIDASRPYSLCDKCVRKLHWIGEHTCEKCGKALPETYRGRFCYDCMIYQHSFSRGFSCLTYGLHERELLFDFKYNGKGYLAEKFADMLFDRITCEDIHVDVIIPVPISRNRLKNRGYNQSALMAEHLSRKWKVSADKNILFRKKETPLLRGFTPVERENALLGAFNVSENGKNAVKGKRVMLIDDIYTTGATVDACSKVLLNAGASEVFVLTLASGGNRKPNI